MNNQPAFERCWQFVEWMARSDQPLEARFAAALVHISPLQEKEFPRECREDFRACKLTWKTSEELSQRIESALRVVHTVFA